MTELTEYGRIVIAKKDGSYGAFYGLTGEINIGRDADSDIRIKIPSVSRLHARVFRDENGDCNLQNMSATNLTTLNGEFVKDFVILRDGDEFCIGLRQFKYQSGDKERDSNIVNENLVSRCVSATEASDENQTLDFAKDPSLKAMKGKLLTPIQEIKKESRTPLLDKLTPMATRQTPLKKTIRSPLRCKEINQSADEVAERVPLPKTIKSPGMTLRNLRAFNMKKSNDSIKEAINMRRRSYDLISMIQSSENKASDIPNEEHDDVTDEASQKRNIRKVINARRKSFSCLSSTESQDIVDCVAVPEIFDAVEDVKKQSPEKELSESSTELAVIAEAEAADSIEPHVEVLEQQEVLVKSCILNSPLRQAINARRRSSLSFAETASELSAEEQVRSVEKVSLVVKRDHMEQFVSTQVSRRLSMGSRSNPVDEKSRALKRKSIAAPRYQPTARLSASGEEHDSEACILAEYSVDEDVVLSCKAADRKSILSLPIHEGAAHTERSPLRTTLKTPLKSSVHREVAVKQALCVQLAVDAFASELEMQGVAPGIAYATAIDTYLSNPSAFGPVMTLVTQAPAPRRRDSLLASLEKKAVPRGMVIFAPSGADPGLSCDLISALTDADMEIIENYASRLEEALGGDSEDAYAIAMDSFIRGIEHCHNNVKVTEEEEVCLKSAHNSPIVTSKSVPSSTIVVTAVDGDGDMKLGAVMRSLFSNPAHREGEGEERNKADDEDERLVSRYAEDLVEDACIDEAVAYGIALDTFLADPVAFRHHIGGVRSRLQEMRSPCRTPEIDYDFYYQKEYLSTCKSTEKKAPASNTHIIFSSPCPMTSPVKMSPLCEENVDDNVVLVAEEGHAAVTLQSALDVNVTVPANNILQATPSTPPKVMESWMLSAAASLQKSLPATSSKKSPFKSAKKIKVPTPRQSRSKEVASTYLDSSLPAVCDRGASLPIDVPQQAVHTVEVVDQMINTDMVVVEEVAVVVEEVAVVVEEVAVAVEEVAVVVEEVAVVVEEVAVEAEEIEEVAVVVEEVAVVVEEVAVVVEEVAVVVEEVTVVVEEVAVVVEEVAVVVAAVEEVAVVVEEVAKATGVKGSDPTPARSTRSKVSTPSITMQSEDLTVKKSRSTRKTSALASVPTPTVAVVAVATESVFDLENVAGTDTVVEDVISAEPALRTVTKGRQKRDVAAEIVSTTKRAKRGQASDPSISSAESSRMVPATIDFSDQVEEVKEEVPAVDPTPSRSIGKVLRSSKKTPLVAAVPEEEVKMVGKGESKGKATRGVKQAIELEEDEEEALALLCDGCDAEHFLDDLGIDQIPEGDWFCESCVIKMAVEVPKSEKKPSKMASKGSYKSTPVKSKVPSTAESEGGGGSRKRTAGVTDSAPEGRRSARLL